MFGCTTQLPFAALLTSPGCAFINASKLGHPNFGQKSSILVPGCGLGHDAIFFAKQNHNVDAVDFSDFAIHHIEKISKKNLRLEHL